LLDLNDVEIFLDVKATMQVLSMMYRRSYEFPADDLTALRSFIEYKKEYKKEVVDRVSKELRELEYGHTNIYIAMNKVYNIYSDDYKELEDQLQLVSFENLKEQYGYSDKALLMIARAMYLAGYGLQYVHQIEISQFNHFLEHNPDYKRSCKNCHELLLGKRGDTEYCSDRCRKQYHRKADK